MKPRRHQFFKNFRTENKFPACKKSILLLKTKMETARVPSQQRRSFEFTSLFERWSIPTDSQAGVFLLRLAGGSRDAIHCGIEVSEPQDAGFNKLNERIRLEIIALKMNDFQKFSRFETLLRGSLRENPGANKTNKTNLKI
jgi:hypothetical protein